jgi:hypothetical protein
MNPANELYMFEAHDNDAGRKFFQDVQHQKNHKIGILVCYCSVLDDCWLAALGNVPDIEVDADRPIDRCPIDSAQRFIQ